MIRASLPITTIYEQFARAASVCFDVLDTIGLICRNAWYSVLTRYSGVWHYRTVKLHEEVSHLKQRRSEKENYGRKDTYAFFN